jgi:hypothetical protein
MLGDLFQIIAMWSILYAQSILSKLHEVSLMKHRRYLHIESLEARLTPAVWYVDDDAVGSGIGTLAQPFATIQQAANVAVAGDTVFIRAGTYRETVTVPNSGTAAQPITFTNYNNEHVVINGTDRVTGWSLVAGNVYKAPMSWNYDGTNNQANQVFSNGSMLNLARWPTEANRDLVRNPYEAVADNITGLVIQGASPGANITIHDADFNEPAGRWVGAKIWVNLARNGFDGQGQTGTVVAHSGNTITVSGIDNRGGDQPWGIGPGTEYYLFAPTTASLVASGGIAAAIDPGEWFYDAAAGQLYVHTLDGSAPTNIEAKRRTYGFVLDGRSHITIRGLHFHATSLTTDLQANERWGTATTHSWGPNGVAPSSNVILDNNYFRYVSHFTDQTGNYQMQWQQQSGVILSGSNHQFINNTVQYSAGSGLSVIGRNSYIYNNVFRDLNYSASEAGAVNFGRAYAPGLAVSEDHVFAYNTVFNTPQQGVNIRALVNTGNSPNDIRARIHHNIIHDVMLRSGDSGAIDTYGRGGGYTRIDHNIIYNVHDQIGVGIYMDFNWHYLIDHNLIFETTYPILLNWQPSSVTDTGSPDSKIYVYNNTALTWSDERLGIENGFANYVNGGNITAGNIMSNGSNVGGTQVANTILTSSSPSPFVDVATANYQLASGSNASVDTGVPAGPSYPGLVHDTLIGLPDRGAFERGMPAWSAGSSLRPSLAVPTNLAATRTSATSTSLTWTNNAVGHSHNEIWRSETNGLTWELIARLPATSTSFTDVGLFPRDFLYRVRADYSPFSNTVASKYRRAGIPVVAGTFDGWSGSPLTTFNYGSGIGVGGTSPGSWLRFNQVDFGPTGSITQVQATFRSGAAGSKITFRTGSLTGPIIAEITSTNGTWSLQTTSASVTPIGGVHDLFLVFSDWGTANLQEFLFLPALLPANTAPNAPTNLTLSAPTHTQVSISWTPTPGATGQVLERGTTADNFSVLATFNGSTSSFVDTGVQSGTRYLYRIRAIRDSRTSQFTTASVTVANEPPPTVPPTVPPTAPPTTPAPRPDAYRLVAAAGGSSVALFRPSDGRLTEVGRVTPFPNVPGVVRAAVGDFDGDGIADVVYATGPGGGDLLRLISGATGRDLLLTQTFSAYPGEPFGPIGMFVAAGDFDGDGRAEIVVSPDQGGGARVQVFQFQAGQLIQRANFFGIDDPAFRGGARISLGDIDGDGTTDLVVAAGFGGGPRIAIYSGRGLFSSSVPPKLVADFFAFEQTLRNGTYVAVGDITGDGKADLVFGGGPGGGPRVLIVDAARLLAYGTSAVEQSFGNFFAFDSSARGGVRISVKDLDGDARLDLIAATGDLAVGRIATYRSVYLTAPEPLAEELLEPFGSSLLTDGIFVG